MSNKQPPQLESEALRDLMDRLKAEKGVSQADFAKRHKIPGGASMISQHLSANRPINLEQAISYAKGFQLEGLQCAVSTISPRLHDEIERAVALEQQAGKAAFRVAEDGPAAYILPLSRRELSSIDEPLKPFKAVTRRALESLSKDRLETVESLILQLVNSTPTKHKTPAKKSASA